MLIPSFKHIKPDKRAATLVNLIRVATNSKNPYIAIDLIKEAIKKYDKVMKDEGTDNANRPLQS
jgi:hypothetical protein